MGAVSTEAAGMQSGGKLRSLFVTIFIHGPPANPRHLWDIFQHHLSDDLAHRLRQDGNAEPSSDQITSLAFHLIANLLAPFEKTLADFSLLTPAYQMEEPQGNRLIAEQLAFNKDVLKEEAEKEVQSLNKQQLHIHREIIKSCKKEQGGIFFIDGPGGTGKTYLENLLLKSVRGLGHIALAVASSGIAALLLDNRRTAHSRFKIPINLKPHSMCSISKQSDLAGMLRLTKLIIWDEAPMMSKFAFEAVDRTLRDVTDKSDVSFGGITFVMCGDFRQILPVVPKGMRPDIVAASIKESYLWSCVQVFKLRQNMRASNHEQIKNLGNRTFADWLLALGEDRLEKLDDDHVQCPSSMIVHNNTVEELLNTIYDGVTDVAEHANQEYYSSRAILAARNDAVAEINMAVLNRIGRDIYEYLSADKVDDEEGANVLPTEYLNRLEVSGWPPHRLRLKIGTPIMLLRNLDTTHGLCKGTRLIVRRCSARVIEAVVLHGDHAGYVTYIPRIALVAEQSGLPFPVRRRQFPVRVAYALTINKSQGQTLQKVGIFLARNVFSHRQLYVAFSRATAAKNVFVHLPAD